MVYTTVKSALTSCPSVSAHFFDNMEVSPGSTWSPSPLGVRLQHVILYSGKLSREKTSQFCGYPQKLSLQNLGRSILWCGNESFLSENHIFTNSQKFSLSKISCYMVAIDFASCLTKRWLDIREMVPNAKGHCPFLYCHLSICSVGKQPVQGSCFNCK